MTTSLNPDDEFLLTLMRLQLGLLNENVAERFDILPTKSSFSFTTWIKLFSKLLKNLVAWLFWEAIRDNLSEAFIKIANNKCWVILDCAEVFIERPKPLDCQAATWSDYKHHNIIKFLVGISPSSIITFLSPCYGGWASDKFINKESGFDDLLERDDEVMVDRGFQIPEDLEKAKETANLQIHVERAINRKKIIELLKEHCPLLWCTMLMRLFLSVLHSVT